MKRGGYIKRKTPLPRPTKPIARRSRVKRKTGGTKHSRRPRETGYMHFCHGRGCELALDVDTQKLLGISHDCSFEPVEFAHLATERRYAAGDVGAGLDRDTHQGIDGNKIGGKPPWYVKLGKFGQKLIRDRLANRARRAWDMLTAEEREEWEREAEAWRASMRRKP